MSRCGGQRNRRLPLVLLGLGACGLAPAQRWIDPVDLPDAYKTFERPPQTRRLSCHIDPQPAELNFGFRFQTGYSVEIPMRQYDRPASAWTIIVKVAPESGAVPTWLISQVPIPSVSDRNALAEFGGGYFVGEGKYRVSLLLVDGSGRACTRSWTVRARLPERIRDIRPGLPAGAVDEISPKHWGRSTARPDGAGTISVLLHAAPLTFGRVRLRAHDRLLLVSVLVSILERVPARNVRLSIFSMDQQNEIYHTAALSEASFKGAVEALNTFEAGLVNYRVVQRPAGHVDLITRLLQREVTSPADAIIVLGPVARWTDPLSDQSLPALAEGRRLYYIQLQAGRRRNDSAHSHQLGTV